MTTTTTDAESLLSSVEWYEKQLAPYCHKLSRDRIAEIAIFAIADVKEDRGLELDSAYCQSIGFLPPERSDEYSDIEALHLATVTSGFYPILDAKAPKKPEIPEKPKKTEPEALYAALGFHKLNIARRRLRSGNAGCSVLSLLEEVRQLRSLLSGEIRIRAPGSHKPNLTSDSKSEHLTKVRSQAARESGRYKANKENREPIIRYFEGVKEILLSGNSKYSLPIDKVARIALMLEAEAIGTGVPTRPST